MPLAQLVLPLPGGTPSALLLMVFEDGLMLLYGDMGADDFFQLKKGHSDFFSFKHHPRLKAVYVDGNFHLAILTEFVVLERRLK